MMKKLLFKKKLEIKNLKDHIRYKTAICKEWKEKEVPNEMKFLVDEIKSNKYKGIIVYPVAVMWDPIQRPHHFLREFAKKGYLCFFCEVSQEDYIIKEMYENVYLINGEEKLMPLLKEEKVTFLITYFLQYVYSELFPNKVIWFDLLDRLDFMSSYNNFSKKIYKKLINVADVVSYSSKKLLFYIKNRMNDAILLPNAANVDDFILDKQEVPKDMINIKNKGKPIIGYYGAIENWFDFDLIKRIDDTNKYSIILIGRISAEIDISKYQFQNVYALGIKKFSELKYYASNFDIASIPFLINKVTDAVSPVKYYEYLALGLPVISTGIYEMRNNESDVLKIVNKKNVIDVIDNLLKEDFDLIKQKAKKIAENNTWQKRADIAEETLKNK